MSPELDRLLCEKYPKVFQDRYSDARTTAMCFGFQCQDGWFSLIDTLCGMFYEDYDRARAIYDYAKKSFESSSQAEFSDAYVSSCYTNEKVEYWRKEMELAESRIPVAVQVKEKFGALDFHVKCHEGMDTVLKYIHFAYRMSLQTCETCGTTKDAKPRSGKWIRTLCPACATADGRPI